MKRLKLFQTQLDFTLEGNAIYTTGLYLPSGITSEIEIDKENEFVSILIFSLTEKTSEQNPSDIKENNSNVTVIHFSQKSLTVSSEKGGIIYIQKSIEEKETLEISVKFSYFSCYPIAYFNSPIIWEKTQHSQVDFGEIICENIIFTLPTETMKQINDMNTIFSTYKMLGKGISQILGDSNHYMFRIFFDYGQQTLEFNTVHYPIIVPFNYVKNILFNYLEPSQESVLLHALLINNILHNKNYNQKIEQCLAFSISIIVLTTYWNYKENVFHFIPDEYRNDCQKILTIIKNKGNGIIQETLKEIDKRKQINQNKTKQNEQKDESKEIENEITFDIFINILENVPDFWMTLNLNAEYEEYTPLKKHNSFANNLTEKLEDIKFMEEEEEMFQRKLEEEEEEEENQSSPSQLLRRFSVDL